jgi:hypothetical protein
MRYLIKTRHLVLNIALSFITASCFVYTAGRDPYAKYYHLTASDADLINAIHKFKADHAEYRLPSGSYLSDKDDGRFYDFYFYIPQDSSVFYCWTSEKAYGSGTRLALVGVKSLNDTHWKSINHDIKRKENERQIHQFETHILSKIVNLLQDSGYEKVIENK